MTTALNGDVVVMAKISTTRILKALVTVPVWSVTETVKLEVPGVFEVPAIRPVVDESVSPVGRVPAEIAKVWTLPLPPITTIGLLTAVPRTTSGSGDVVEICRGVPAAKYVNPFVRVADWPLEETTTSAAPAAL